MKFVEQIKLKLCNLMAIRYGDPDLKISFESFVCFMLRVEIMGGEAGVNVAGPASWAAQLSPGLSDAAPAGSGKVKIRRIGFLNRPRVISLKQGTDIEEIKLSLHLSTSHFLQKSRLYISE